MGRWGAMLVLSFLPAIASGQSLKAAADLSKELETIGFEINGTRRNLLQMARDGSGPEERAISNMGDIATASDMATSHLGTLMFLYSEMVNEKDRALVKGFMLIAAKEAVDQIENAVGAINKYLFIFAPLRQSWRGRSFEMRYSAGNYPSVEQFRKDDFLGRGRRTRK